MRGREGEKLLAHNGGLGEEGVPNLGDVDLPTHSAKGGG